LGIASFSYGIYSVIIGDQTLKG